MQRLSFLGSEKPFGKGKKGKFPNELWGFFGEEFRNLRTKLISAFKDERHKIVLVTSAVPAEGKTAVAVNLARSLAKVGWKTILIDSDLRRPDIHTLFGIGRNGGLSEAVQGTLPLEDTICPTDLPELDLLPAGAQAEAPVELINSPAFQKLVKDLAARYDCVVLDSPPVISIADTLLLARYADGILLVVGGLQTPREIVKTALEQLQDTPILGVVLNGISTPKKYGYYY